MAQPGKTARRIQAVRDAGLRRLSGATVALSLTSLAGVGVVAAVVKSATEQSAQRSAPTSATTETGQPDASQPGSGSGSGSGGSGTGSSSGSTDPGSSGLLPDQSGSGQIQPPAYDPAPVPGYRQPNASSGGS